MIIYADGKKIYQGKRPGPALAELSD
jgi:hypothetical protein